MAAGMHLTDEEAESMTVLLESFLLHYNWLTNHALEANYLAYNKTIKEHVMIHLVEHAKFLNPRFVWAYKFERMIGLVARSAHSCTAGSTLVAAGRKTLENYRVALSIRRQRLEAAVQGEMLLA